MPRRRTTAAPRRPTPLMASLSNHTRYPIPPITNTTGGGLTSSTGERVGITFRAPHGTPHPLINRPHPAAAQAQRAPAHAHDRQAHPVNFGHHRRATVVTAGNPATVQLHGSDTTVSLPLAQHVTVPMLAPGGTVAGLIFDLQDPSDGLIVAAY